MHKQHRYWCPVAEKLCSEPAGRGNREPGRRNHGHEHEHEQQKLAKPKYDRPKLRHDKLSFISDSHVAVLERRADTVRSTPGRWPQHYLPALDTPVHVLAAFEHCRPIQFSPLVVCYWADDDRLNLLADRPLPTVVSPATRRCMLAMDDADLGRRPDLWPWLFPISDELDTAFDSDGTPVRQPCMPAHFLLRYDADKSQQLRCHTHQNLERVWRLLGITPHHPANPLARTQWLHLAGVSRLGLELGQGQEQQQQGLGWEADKASLVPQLVARVLRHLRMLGWAFEAELTYSVLLEHMAPPPGHSATLVRHEVQWRRVARWELADHLLQSVCKH